MNVLKDQPLTYPPPILKDLVFCVEKNCTAPEKFKKKHTPYLMCKTLEVFLTSITKAINIKNHAALNVPKCKSCA